MLLNGTAELIDAHEYPATTAELIDDLGDRTLELPNGAETVGDVLTRLEEETFESPEDARFALHCAVSKKAIGRYGYSDRDPTPPGCKHAPDAVSF